jgi:hypothetical protein
MIASLSAMRRAGPRTTLRGPAALGRGSFFVGARWSAFHDEPEIETSMTMSFVQPTIIHPAARPAALGLRASCANGTGGEHRWAPMEVPGSYGAGFGSEKDRRDHTFGGGAIGAGAR